MTKSIDINPVMFGETLLRKVELDWLQEALNLSAKAEVASFIREHINVYDKHGFFRFLATNKTRCKFVRTALGTVRGSIPAIQNRGHNETPRIEFRSRVFPSHVSVKTNYNASLAWRFLEGLAMGDFSDVKRHLMDVFYGCDRRRLSPWLSRTFTARRELWLKRSLADPLYPFIWIDKVQLRHKGPHKDFRLYLAAGLTINGVAKLLGVYRSANDNDYLSWYHLFEELKERGLNPLPPVTGVLDNHAIMGIRQSYGTFKPAMPDTEIVLTCLSRLPAAGQEYGRAICEAITRSKNPRRINHYVSLFVRQFAVSDPRVTIDLVNPERFLLRLNVLKPGSDDDTMGMDQMNPQYVVIGR
jgi:hypothetical protein